MISATLLGQSVLSGFFAGCLYALLGLGLTLTWRYLKVINLAHFAFVLIAAYLTFQLIGKNELNPLLVSALLIPVFFIAGVGQQALILHYKVNEFASIIVTFGFAMIAEAGLQWFWSADFQKLETHFLRGSAEVGGLFLPMMDILMAAVAFALCIGVWAAMRYTWLGKALRASLDNPQIAAAFGIPNQRLSYLVAGASAAIAAIGGIFVALLSTLAPSQIFSWLGVVFAAALLGGLGSPLGILGASVLLGVSEHVTMAVTSPAWAPVVPFTILMIILILWPERV